MLGESHDEKLLGDALPAVIRNEKEYRRLLGAAKRIMETPDEKIAPDEGRLLESLSVLIEEYEDRVHPLLTVGPHRCCVTSIELRKNAPLPRGCGSGSGI